MIAYGFSINLMCACYGVAICSFDPHRTLRIIDYHSSYANEVRKWVHLYQPFEEGTLGCGGYVLAGEQRCWYNSFEAVYILCIIGVVVVHAFYLRMPLRWLLQISQLHAVQPRASVTHP